ncbi:MAG: PASTA domain-containing protein [Ruminococcaceae bacterium]|nr:PASTA domain-containing protein [Oscillospiraceae bacterium]
MPKPSVSRKTLKRSSVVALGLVVCFLFLALRIFSIQIFDFARYQKKVIDQLTTESPVRADRGEILDAAGRVLATNRTVYRVSVFPNVIARQENSEEVRGLIAKGLAAAVKDLKIEKVMEHLTHTSELERTVVRSADTDTANAVLAFVGEYGLQDMIAVEAISTRYYPYGDLAAHLLGFTGSDGQGLYGLELQYNSALAGQDGSYITARDSTGNELPGSYEAYLPATDGYTVQTTIDAYVQAVLEEQLERTLIESGAANRVCGIVMDVNTGAVLAMATGPSFNLNDPFALNAACAKELAALGHSPDSEEYKAAQNRLLLETWSNKAVTEIYMPGSTFKTLTCSAVLEEDAVIDLDERFYCSGSLQVADRTIRCHKVGGHGSLTFREGLQNSCNPVMMTIAARLGCETFYDYVKAFGLLEKTGIDLPGEGNSIFHAASNFTELDLATASFGQNFKVSILQMLTAVGAVANGGDLLTPYLVQSMTDADGNTVYQHEMALRRQVISTETAKTISEILAGGVAGDGGAKNAYVAGYRVAAKTGTSEKIGDDKSARIGSCVAYAPADDPQVAVIIVVDEPTDGSRYGSVVAAPYVAAVLDGILSYLGVEAVYTEEELKNMALTVPNCVGWSREQAAEMLFAAGFQLSFVGEGSVITSQTPQWGSSIEKSGAHIVLTLGDGVPQTVTVPQLVGLTASAANRILIDLGLNLSIDGAFDSLAADKTVLEQSIAAGIAVPKGTVIRLRFPYEEKIE